MAMTTDRILSLAKSWIGKNEKDGTHKMIVDIYNSQKDLPRDYKVSYNDNWCAATISALAIHLKYTSIIPIECSCGEMIEKAKKMGIWKENENRVPVPADIILYDWQDSGKGDNKGWPDHVGIVYKVEGNKITVIEGNYSNTVKYRTLEVNGKYIRGYITPKYDVQVASHATYPKYSGSEMRIDIVLKAIGADPIYIGSYKKRSPIANANGIKNYTGTYDQNVALIKLAKKGKLVRP